MRATSRPTRRTRSSAWAPRPPARTASPTAGSPAADPPVHRDKTPQIGQSGRHVEMFIVPGDVACHILVRWKRQLPPSGGGSSARGALRARVAGPSDQALHWLAGWYAIALRLGGAILFTAVAVLAATKEISGWWLAAALTALWLWSAFFAWRVRRSGLTPTVVLADAAVVSALALAQQHMVPAALIEDNTTWMLPLACTSVYILQIALRPRFSLPGAAMVVIAYGFGAGDLADAWLLVVETIV